MGGFDDSAIQEQQFKLPCSQALVLTAGRAYITPLQSSLLSGVALGQLPLGCHPVCAQ